jgi:protein disulfide-isomerase
MKHQELPEVKKMKVEIWSDIMCPFCYIGKRHFEEALKGFGHHAELEMEWKSFQLDPEIPKERKEIEHVYDYLAKRKGISHDQSVKLHDRVIAMAHAAGLVYNFDKAIVANSFDAHRVIQLAKSKGLGNEIEERFFKAYFTDGMDLGDPATLIEIGKEIGLEGAEVREALHSDDVAYQVKQDIDEAAQLGIRGVPFFVFDRRHAVSGAQPADVFLETMEKAFEDWRKNNPTTE